MKNLFFSSILFFLFLIFDSLEQNAKCSFKLIVKKNVPFANYSLVPRTKILAMTKTICLFQCMKNENCSFVIYNKGYCSLHTEFALTRLKDDDLNVVFEKKNINDYCASLPCKNNGSCLSRHDRYECFCSIGYFGSSCNKKISDYNCSSNYFRLDETQSCIPCRSNFNSYDQYPFNCYHFHTSLNFESAKAFCETLNSTLWAPKSYSERSITNTEYLWVNSIISYVGEPFVWPDGSRVHGFEAGEPKNYQGDNYLLYENVLEMKTYPKLNDIRDNRTRRTVCQQN